MKTTLKDIAEKVGVTAQLVSFYLNHPETKRVAKTTRDKINTAVRELHYQPNGVARALITGKTHTIGLILGGFSLRKRGCFVHELMNAAKKHGYHLIIAITNYDQDEERQALEYMLAQQVDGILYHLYLDPESDVYNRLKRQHYPILMHVPQAGNDFNTIGNEPDAIRTALEELKARGHKKICYLSSQKDFYLPYFYEYCKELKLNAFFSSSEKIEMINEEIEKTGSTAVVFNNFSAEKYCLKYPDRNIDLVIPYSVPFEYFFDPRIIGVIYHDFRGRAAGEIDLMLEVIRNPDKKVSCKLFPSQFLNAERWREIYEYQCSSPEYALYVN